MLIPHSTNLCSKHAEKMLSIKICGQCNASCSFCVDRGGHNGSKIDVPAIAFAAIARTEYQTVIITGGEPFLVINHVLELCKMLRRHKKRIVLNTNGSLLTAEIVEKLNPLIDELQVSVHHFDEDISGEVFEKEIVFTAMQDALAGKTFALSINSTFNRSYNEKERNYAVQEMVMLCNWIGAERLRLTELKKVDGDDFVPASDFFPADNEFCNRSSEDLITNGCTHWFNQNNVLVSVKRLCSFAKGTNATAFSCCFINTDGQKKIDVETVDTFKVIYSDGSVTDDWIFAPEALNADN